MLNLSTVAKKDTFLYLGIIFTEIYISYSSLYISIIELYQLSKIYSNKKQNTNLIILISKKNVFTTIF